MPSLAWHASSHRVFTWLPLLRSNLHLARALSCPRPNSQSALSTAVFGYNDAFCKLQPFLRKWRAAVSAAATTGDTLRPLIGGPPGQRCLEPPSRPKFASPVALMEHLDALLPPIQKELRGHAHSSLLRSVCGHHPRL